MAVTATVTVDNGGELGSGNDQYAYGQIAISSTYVTGGFAVDLPAGNYDMSNIRTSARRAAATSATGTRRASC
jgi:hypothetical protein